MDSEGREDSADSTLHGWTREEKYYLLQGLKSYGSTDIDHIQEYVISKTESEIIAAIRYYQEKALKHPIFNKAPEKNVRKRGDKVVSSLNNPSEPLASWAKLLTESLSFDELRTETATALRMIAELENIPEPNVTNGINFQAIYHELANAMEGKTLTKDKLTAAVINKCIVETAASSKSFIRQSALSYILSSINLDHHHNSTLFIRPTQDHKLRVLRHLIGQKNYNPFNIPEEHLEPNYETVWKTGLSKKT